MPTPAKPKRERIALVLAGGGARGAYEAGALAALAPALAAAGQAPNIIVGTSIGALNGSFFAARADQPLEASATAALEMWRELSWEDALRPLVSVSELGRLLGASALLAGLPGGGLPGLLDPTPLRGTLERLVSFERIAVNVASGALSAAAVVATDYHTTRSVVFHDGGPDLPLDPLRAIDYFATTLMPEHVLASAAIPGAFPAVAIQHPSDAGGWYGDGGVRLNAPLTPALALGADRVVVIGLNSSVTHAGGTARPDALDGVAQLLQVVLADQLAGDVATLAAVNEALMPAAPPAGKAAGKGRGKESGKRRTGHRTIPYIFVAPSDRLEIGRLAREVYRRRYASIAGFVRDRNIALLGRIVDADRSPIHGELLSYLFLAREFLDELIALGHRDGQRWIESQHDAGLWQVGRPKIGGAAPPSPTARKP
jgi:NTE family protein